MVKVKAGMVDDYYLSRLQDDITAAIEAVHLLELRLASLQNKVESMKRDKGLSLQSFSVRGEAEFVE